MAFVKAIDYVTPMLYFVPRKHLDVLDAANMPLWEFSDCSNKGIHDQ